MRCPDAIELVALTFGEVEADEHVLAHLETCRRCGNELRYLLEGATALAGIPRSGAGAACLGDVALARIAALGLRTSAEGETEHLSACSDCRFRLLSAMSARSAPALVDAPAIPERGRRPARHGWRVGGAAAAVMVGLLLLPALVRPRSADRGVAPPRAERDPALTMAPAPTPLTPVGSVAAADLMVWTRVPGADRYSVTVFTREGHVVWEGETRDTVAGLPPGIALPTGELHLWKVVARTSWDRTVESELAAFTVDESGTTR